MKCHWHRCRINQHQFCHYCVVSKSNNGDYVTKLGAALENFPAQKRKKSFDSTYARKIEAKKTSQRTIRATPKIGNFHFRQWWPIST